MSNFKLNLPVDIPWKRIAVSQDMIDTNICDGAFPARWRSSLAIFEYQPDAESQTYDDLIISYVKVVCTITGYQERGEDGAYKEIGTNNQRPGLTGYWKEQDGIENYNEILEKYYPCYGAVLEVAFGPEDKTLPWTKFPYIMDFEPKKRELYELVSETGESLSRTLNTVSIGKNNTTTQSNEVLDIDKGFSVGGQVQGGGYGIGGNYAKQGEWGTKNVNQNQEQSIKNTETSQEKRESQSHTTQLTQMYHQLDSYHLGTNRAVFFIQPRPHTVETEHTFVNGPRNIEGIQEFMLVVARPKEVEKICVEALLETGHIGNKINTIVNSNVDRKQIPWGERFDAEDFSNEHPQTFTWKVEEKYSGYKIIEVGAITWQDAQSSDTGDRLSTAELLPIPPYISTQNEDFVEVKGTARGKRWYTGIAEQNAHDVNAHFPFQVTITIAKKAEETTYQSVKTLFLTSRGICSCEPKIPVKELTIPSLSYEKPIKYSYLNKFTEENTKYVNPEVAYSMSIKDANILRDKISNMVISSRNDFKNRYEKGKITSIAETRFASETLSNILGKAGEMKVSEMSNISEKVAEKINAFFPNLTVSQVLEMHPDMQKDLFDLTTHEVSSLRISLSGLNQPVADKRLKWLTQEQLDNIEKISDNRNKK